METGDKIQRIKSKRLRQKTGIKRVAIEGALMTGYMQEMRKLVGHRTIIQCAASIICIDKEGRILLGRRSDNHMLGYAGGSIEIDECVEDCAKRELLEEMGTLQDLLDSHDFYIIDAKVEEVARALLQDRTFCGILNLMIYTL